MNRGHGNRVDDKYVRHGVRSLLSFYNLVAGWRRIGCRGNRTRAHVGRASVYEYHNGPERLVFMAPRLEVMSQATFERYEAILKAMSQHDPRWLELIRAGDGELPAILLDSRYCRAAINGLLQPPGMRLVFAERTAAVFITDTLADQLKLPPVSFAPLSDLPEAQRQK